MFCCSWPGVSPEYSAPRPARNCPGKSLEDFSTSMGRRRRWSRLFSVAIRRSILQIVLPVLVRVGRLPIFRIFLKHLGVMSFRGVMEIHPHRWRGEQHVNRDTLRRCLKNPCAVYPKGAMGPMAGVINAVVGS